MGDAFADPTRIELLDLLQNKTGFERGILGCSGSDSVEAALKTARIATGRTKYSHLDEVIMDLPLDLFLRQITKQNLSRLLSNLG